MATATTKTWAIQGENSPAQAGRILATMLVTEGVFDVDGDAWKVAEDTGANMQVKVGSGAVGDLAAVDGDAQAGQGTYLVRHYNATQTLVVPAADSSNDRIDRVVLQIFDDEADSSGDSYADLEIVEGTPAGTPSAPDIPDSAISLATIEVGAGVSAITNANITDTRSEIKCRGELVQTVVFASSGTFTKADYPWLRKIRVKVQGGGGAGGGAPATGASQGAVGGGGGSGAYAEATIDVSDLAASETVTVGAGGVGAAGTTGGTGGDSSFGAHVVCAGGLGAYTSGLTSTTVFARAGLSTSAPTGTATLVGDRPGQPGEVGISVATVDRFGGGAGAASVMGSGANPANSVSADSAGSAATSPGAGGGGAGKRASQATDRAGGDGGDGVIVIQLYA